MAITAVLVAFAMTAGLYADMMPISPSNVAYPSAHPCQPSHCEPINGSDRTNEQVAFDLGFLSVVSLAGQPINTEPTSPTQPSVQVLTTDRSSLDLCLYALIGLGLCRSGHWAKKSALGVAPEWYHSGGPYQIGHSHAISPETLCPTPVGCFIQPDGSAEHLLPQCRSGAIASLWCNSQCTPTLLASRGPPLS